MSRGSVESPPAMYQSGPLGNRRHIYRSTREARLSGTAETLVGGDPGVPMSLNDVLQIKTKSLHPHAHLGEL
jgi:hypothetical protein